MSSQNSSDSIISELDSTQAHYLDMRPILSECRENHDIARREMCNNETEHLDTRCLPNLSATDDSGITIDRTSLQLDTELESVITLSQTEKIQNDSTFKKIPELSLAYSRKKLSNSNRRNYCLGCAKIQQTNQLERLVKHVLNCPKISQELKNTISRRSKMLNKQYTTRDARLNLLWAEVIVGGNLPISVVTSQPFKQFMREALPDWKVDDRHTYSSAHIHKLAELTENNFRQNLATDANKYFSLEFDHWSEATKRSLLGIVVTSIDGDRFLLDLKDVSLEGKSAKAIVDSLKVTMQSIPSFKVNSIVSDSDSACKKARELIVKLPDWQHLIQHRCVAHLLNRLGNLFTKCVLIEETITWATQVSAIASNCPKILEKIRQSGSRRVVKGGNTRWYSNADMLDSLVRNRDVIMEEIIESGNVKRIELITQDDHWSKVKQASKLMRPIADCISVSERKNGSLGEAVKAIFELGKTLFDMNWQNPLVVAAIEAYLTYISINKLGEDEFGLFLAAYILDPRNKLNHMTEDAIDLALKSIIKIAEFKNKTSKRTIVTSLIPEFQSYCAFEGKYGKVTVEDTDVLDWWSKLHDCAALGEVACRIAGLRSSSSNIERTFSTLKLIQGYSRMNFALETLVNFGKIRFGQKESLREFLDLEPDCNYDSDASNCQQPVSETSSCVSSLLSPLSGECLVNDESMMNFEVLTSDTARLLLNNYTKFVCYTRNSSETSVTARQPYNISLEDEIRKARYEREARKKSNLSLDL